MTPAHYHATFALGAALFGAAVVAGQRRAGGRGLWLAYGTASAAFAALGWLDWARLPTKESPLIAYLLVATLPTLAAALTASWARRRGLGPATQFILAAGVCYVVVVPTLLLGAYFLAPLLPGSLGCCPL